MTKEQKEYCMLNLFALVIERLSHDVTQEDSIEIAKQFVFSETCDLLFNPKTRMWAEGPDSIIDMYTKELKANTPNRKTVKAIKEADRNVKHNKGKTYHSADELLDDIKKGK